MSYATIFFDNPKFPKGTDMNANRDELLSKAHALVDQMDDAALQAFLSNDKSTSSNTKAGLAQMRERGLVARWSADNAAVLAKVGRTPIQNVQRFCELQKKTPGLTAAQYGVPRN